MPTIALSTWSLLLVHDHRDAIRFAAQHGFGGVEIWSSPLDFWPRTVTAREAAAVRVLAQRSNLAIALHFAFGSNDLGDVNPGHRQESRRQLLEAIRLCPRVGARVLVVHSGRVPAEFPRHEDARWARRYHREELREHAASALIESLQEAAAAAATHGVTLALENLGHGRDSIQRSYQDLLGWLAQVNTPSLQLCVDVGHAHLEGGVTAALTALAAHTVHVHLDDNDGTRSEHGVLGTGTIEWAPLAPFLRGFPGMLSLEVLDRDDPEGGVLRSRRFLDRLLAG